MIHGGPWIALVVALSSAPGCAVNDVGAVQVRWREGETARAVSLEAWGAHLVLGGGDSSLTLGRSRRTYVFPRTGASLAPSTFADLRSGAALHPVTCDPCPGLWDAGVPIVRMTRTEGLALDFNGCRVGVALGARAREMLRIDGETNGMTMYVDTVNGDADAAWIGGVLP
jgi:hypothetical protein